MVTTTPENIFQKLAQRDRWDLKDMAKKDEWLLRTSALLHKAGVAVALKHGRPTVASIKAISPLAPRHPPTAPRPPPLPLAPRPSPPAPRPSPVCEPYR